MNIPILGVGEEQPALMPEDVTLNDLTILLCATVLWLGQRISPNADAEIARIADAIKSQNTLGQASTPPNVGAEPT